MSSRERKRAERRKRKERTTSASGPSGSSLSGAEPAAVEGEPPATSNGSAPTLEDVAAEAEAREVSRSELRNERARESLEPLAEDERPTIVTIGAIVSIAIAVSIVVGYLSGAQVSISNNSSDTHEANLFQVIPPTVLFGFMAWGMLRSRYWAVLGFEAIMAILMVGAFITLIAAATVLKAIFATAVLTIAGLLFWFTVKALARIQMPRFGER